MKNKKGNFIKRPVGYAAFSTAAIAAIVGTPVVTAHADVDFSGDTKLQNEVVITTPVDLADETNNQDSLADANVIIDPAKTGSVIDLGEIEVNDIEIRDAVTLEGTNLENANVVLNPKAGNSSIDLSSINAQNIIIGNSNVNEIKVPDKVTSISKVPGVETSDISIQDGAGNAREDVEIVELGSEAPQAPAAPEVDEVDSEDTEVTGTAAPGSIVTVKAGDSVIGTADADQKGNFSANIDAQAAGTALSVIAIDEDGNESDAATVTVTAADNGSGETNPEATIDSFEEVSEGAEEIAISGTTSAIENGSDLDIEVVNATGDTLGIEAVETSDNSYEATISFEQPIEAGEYEVIVSYEGEQLKVIPFTVASALETAQTEVAALFADDTKETLAEGTNQPAIDGAQEAVQALEAGIDATQDEIDELRAAIRAAQELLDSESAPEEEPPEEADNAITDSKTQPIGDGVKLSAFESLNADGWINGERLEVDLSNDDVSVDLLQSGDEVTDIAPISEATNREDAIASVNGDFYDINRTNASIGAEIQDGELIKGANEGRETSAAITTEGVGKLVDVFLEGTVSFQDQTYSIDALNQNGIPNDGIGLYNALWGQAPRTDISYGTGSVYEVVVEDGEVVKSSEEVGSGEIGENKFFLIGRGNGAERLSQLNVGDTVSVDYKPRKDEDGNLDFAIGGNPVLVKNGEVQDVDDQTVAPRTAVGFSQDGETMFLTVVDGRQTSSRGLTLKGMAELMQRLGAYTSLNLDGGGSSTLTARTPGESVAEVQNNPSDGSERPIPNGVGIFTEEGSGELAGINVLPVITDENAYRVFPDLSRNFTAIGFDDAYDPVQVNQFNWEIEPNGVGNFDDNGVFHASQPGLAVAAAGTENIEGETPVQVLGELDSIEANKSRISLEEGETDSFSVTGYDKNGYDAPIEAGDIELNYDESVIQVEANADGSFTVIPEQGEASTTIEVSVLDETFHLPVNTGYTEQIVSDFEDESQWTHSVYPQEVEASLEVAEGREGGNGVQMNYDYTTSTATRAAYLRPAQELKLPANTQHIGLWVHGDGNGAWLRATISDATGSEQVLDLADSVDWTGWEYVETSIPEGFQGPFTLVQIYPTETDPNAQYTGELVFDDLTVKVPPETEVPEQEQQSATDPLIVQNEPLGEDRWTFAVLSDTQFVAQNPNSDVMQRTRETLQQIIAADPEFLVINGDFVDTGYPEDFDLAKQVIDEEIGDRFPVYYVPGNHERTGTGSLDNFKEVFEGSTGSFVQQGTQFIMLDSSAGSYRTSDFNQLLKLEDTLQSSAENPEIQNVVLFSHHPTNDPLTTDNSQLSDRKEVELIEGWLTDFREQSGGKGAIFISSHASIFNVDRVDSVPYMVTGSAGKDPYGSPNNGGFLGWTMFGIEEEPSSVEGIERPAETDWIQAKVNPLLSDIMMKAPGTVAAGETIQIEATGHQPDGITIPLRYPASVNWTGSDNVFIGNTAEAEEAINSSEHDAVFDYTTGELTAIQPGEITLEVASNNVEEAVTIVIE